MMNGSVMRGNSPEKSKQERLPGFFNVLNEGKEWQQSFSDKSKKRETFTIFTLDCKYF